MAAFRVTFTADFFGPDGQPKFDDYGRDLLEGRPGIESTQFPEHHAEIAPEQLAAAQGVVVLTPRVTAHSLSQSEDLLIVSRFGVGYDTVDVDACSAADVLATIARGAVDRPVAEATVGWMIGLSHHVLIKDRLVREGRWDDRVHFMGTELRDQTLGIIGMGGIGKALLRLLAGFGMKRPLVFDPYLSDEAAEACQAHKVDLARLLDEADYVSVHCPLSDETRNLIGANELARMKSTAFLINTARGGIVDEDALFAALSERRIAGAAIDCFVGEPLASPHRFGSLDNVLLAPHSIAWTREMFRDIGRAACQTMLDLASGVQPQGVLNPELFDRPSFQKKWARLKLG